LRTASAPVGIGSEIRQLQDGIRAKAKSVVDQAVPYQGVASDRYEKYVEANREIYARAKRAAGVAPHMKLESITNVKTLKAMDAYMEARVRETQTTK
jgi:hypothetical protein